MPRALVVEDEPHIRELLQLHLRLEGIETVVCDDGGAALRLVADEPFDVIVLDLMLPTIDGLTVCTAVRRSTSNATTPVLILTARREESDTLLGLESGADDHLARVFDRFHKADASRAGTVQPSGSGLGLSIVRAIVTAHGGRVTAANRAQGGRVFRGPPAGPPLPPDVPVSNPS